MKRRALFGFTAVAPAFFLMPLIPPPMEETPKPLRWFQWDGLEGYFEWNPHSAYDAAYRAYEKRIDLETFRAVFT